MSASGPTPDIEVYRTRFVHEANLVRQALSQSGIASLVLVEDWHGQRYPVAVPFEETYYTWLVLVQAAHLNTARDLIRNLPIEQKWT